MRLNILTFFIFIQAIGHSSIAQSIGNYQSHEDTLIISSEVGKIIDKSEKKRFHILPYFYNFQFTQAVFILNQDSTITMHALIEEKEILKNISSQEYYSIKNQIEYIFTDEYDLAIKKSKPKKLSISLLTGVSFGRARKNFESAFISSGLGQTETLSLLFFRGGQRKYPYSNNNPVFEIDATYNIYSNSELSFGFGLSDNIVASGYDGYNHLVLKSNIWTISSCYSLFLGNRRVNFFIGPIINIHSVNYECNDKKTNINNLKYGFLIGTSIHVIEKRNFFLAINAKYKFSQKTLINSFQYGGGNDYFGNPKPINVFRESEINLGCLNIGFSIGFR